MGTVVISLDAELTWGFHDLEEVPLERIKYARTAWQELLGLFDEYDVPATWAIVGHLMLEECDGQHDSHPAPEGWFERDPGGTATDTSNWFAPDLVDAIQNASVDHDIGCHSFSHVYFGDEATSPQLAAAELRTSKTIAEQWNIDLKSFVFPRNKIGYRDQLAEYGFTCYRGNKPAQWYDGTWFRPIGKTMSMAASQTPPPTVRSETDEYGLVNVPASLDLFTFEGWPKRIVEQIGENPVVRKAKLGIDAAAESDEIFHMWFHPNNLKDTDDVERVQTILNYLADVHEQTELEVLTMEQIARRFG